MRMLLSLAIAGVLAPALASAQTTLQIPNIVELSGPGAVSGTNWRDGIILAVEEINAKGGILGRKIEVTHADTQSNPGVSRAQVQKALDANPYVVLGPVFSGSVKVNMLLTQAAEVPQIVGAEAADITQMGNPYVFRTAFGQQTSIPKLANYFRDQLKAKQVAVLWVNNDFGKGGRDAFIREMNARNIKVVGDVSTEQGQVDFAADVAKLKSLIGETTLLGQKVIELAGVAANGVRGHVGLSTDAPIEAVKAFSDKFRKRFNYIADHNGIKGYTAIYTIKNVTEKIGKFDSKLFAKTLHGLTITPAQEPGILMETTWDANGDIDRISFLAEVSEGKQKIVETLPKLGK